MNSFENPTEQPFYDPPMIPSRQVADLSGLSYDKVKDMRRKGILADLGETDAGGKNLVFTKSEAVALGISKGLMDKQGMTARSAVVTGKKLAAGVVDAITNESEFSHYRVAIYIVKREDHRAVVAENFEDLTMHLQKIEQTFRISYFQLYLVTNVIESLKPALIKLINPKLKAKGGAG